MKLYAVDGQIYLKKPSHLAWWRELRVKGSPKPGDKIWVITRWQGSALLPHVPQRQLVALFEDSPSVDAVLRGFMLKDHEIYSTEIYEEHHMQ